MSRMDVIRSLVKAGGITGAIGAAGGAIGAAATGQDIGMGAMAGASIGAGAMGLSMGKNFGRMNRLSGVIDRNRNIVNSLSNKNILSSSGPRLGMLGTRSSANKMLGGAQRRMGGLTPGFGKYAAFGALGVASGMAFATLGSNMSKSMRETSLNDRLEYYRQRKALA